MTLNRISKAIEHLSSLDFSDIPVGKYIVNDDFYYLVQEYNSRNEEDCRLESHQKFADIQMVLSGTEIIATTDISRVTIETPYNEEKDVMFWEKPETMMQTVLTAGSMMVLYPENAHLVGLKVSESVPVRKVVGKVRL